MKKATLKAFLLALLAPIMSTWADVGSPTTYYAALKVSVSSSGGGKVYAGTSTAAPGASDYSATSKQTAAQTSTTKNDTKKLYAFAQADDGYEFAGWSKTNGGSDLGQGTAVGTAYRYDATVTFNSTSSPNAQEWYATFKEKVLDAFSITFETSANGTYTVDGAAPANKTGLTKPTKVVLASLDEAFLNWTINGEVVTPNPHTASCTENTTISANFLTADQVTTVSSYDELEAALANAQYVKITVPSGKSITVAKGATLTVPAGKQLMVEGTLAVVGTVSNSGTISGNGTLYKISYLIDQGEVQIVYQADGTECKTISGTAHHAGESAHYYKTKVTVNTPTVSGTVSMTPKWGVLLDGENTYPISAQSVNGVSVSLDKTLAANKITGITGSLTSSNIQPGETGNSKNWVLFSDCSLKGPVRSDATTRLNFNGTIDLCGHKLTFGQARTYSDFYGVYLNGTIDFQPSTDCQNGGEIFFNCSSITIKNIKGSPTMLFYDCGTAAAPATLTFGYQSGAHRKAQFFGGYYTYSFSSSYDSGYASVYGGSYTSDPSSYLSDVDKLEVKYDGSKYYVVQEKKEVSNIAAIGSTPYETLEAAISVSKTGDMITLLEAVDLTGTSVEIPAGKDITIALERHKIFGGTIVNNGTLVITDSGVANESTVESDIENNGVLDLIFGTYKGSIVNNSKGTLVAHNGIYDGHITKNGGTVELIGGLFADDVTDLADDSKCRVFNSGSKFRVCKLPNQSLEDRQVGGAAGYSLTPYADAVYEVLRMWKMSSKTLRSDYSSAQWILLADNLSFVEHFHDKVIDATLLVDRDVAGGTLTLTGNMGVDYPITPSYTIGAGTTNRLLSAAMLASGKATTGFAFYRLFCESSEIKTVAVSAKSSSDNNKGTLCKTMVELWGADRASDYTSSNKHMITNTVHVVGARVIALNAGSNKAMIRPATGEATFYATLGKAMESVSDGGTVMLANDCTEPLPLDKEGTYIFDTMGFAHSDSYTLGEGLVLVGEPEVVDSSAKALIPDAVATKYVVVGDPVKKVVINGATPTASQEAELRQEDGNGNAHWQNYVMGQDGATAAAIVTSTNGTETVAEVVVSFEVPSKNTGYTVKYAFDEVDAEDKVIEAGAVQDKPQLDLTKVTKASEPHYFKMRTVLESTDHTVKSEVAVEHDIGVMKVDSDAEFTILAVPWKSFDGGNVKVSELVHAASLSEDDMITAYDNDGNVKSWYVKGGVWVPATDVVDGAQTPKSDPAAFGLARGKGVWLKRSDTEKPIYLLGLPPTSDDAVTTTLAAPASGEAGWNLVASPKLEAMDIASKFKDNTGDEIIVPTAGTPKHYTYKNGAWGYPGATVESEVKMPNGKPIKVLKSSHKTDDTEVKPGTGFWYLNKGGEKTISW